MASLQKRKNDFIISFNLTVTHWCYVLRACVTRIIWQVPRASRTTSSGGTRTALWTGSVVVTTRPWTAEQLWSRTVKSSPQGRRSVATRQNQGRRRSTRFGQPWWRMPWTTFSAQQARSWARLFETTTKMSRCCPYPSPCTWPGQLTAIGRRFARNSRRISTSSWTLSTPLPPSSGPTWRSAKGDASWRPPTSSWNSSKPASTGTWTVPSSWFGTPSTSSSPSTASCVRATAANKFPSSTASCLGRRRRCTRRSSRLSLSSSVANRRWRGWPWTLRSGCGRQWRRS